MGRKQRQHREAERQKARRVRDQLFLARRNQYLRSLGLEECLADRKVRDLVGLVPYTEPVIRHCNNTPAEAVQALQDLCASTVAPGSRVRYGDALAFHPIVTTLHASRKLWSAPQREAVARAHAASVDHYERWWNRARTCGCFAHSHPAVGFTSVACKWEEPSKKNKFVITARRHRPETKRVFLQQQPRQVYRLWHDDYLNVTVGGRELPLYVQQHALDRYDERVDSDIPRLLLLYFVAEAVQRGVIHYQGNCLLPIKVGDKEAVLGYFLLTQLVDCVVAVTFLLSTMEGTPSGDRLCGSLRLGRHDLEYHQLDRLSAFCTTDLVTDPRTSRLLSDGGMGDLMEVLRSGFGTLKAPIPKAQELLHYIGAS